MVNECLVLNKVGGNTVVVSEGETRVKHVEKLG